MRRTFGPRPVWTLLCMFMAMMALWSITVWYMDKKERERDREWCELIVAIDDGYKAQAPTTEAARRLAKLMDRRRASLGC